MYLDRCTMHCFNLNPCRLCHPNSPNIKCYYYKCILFGLLQCGAVRPPSALYAGDHNRAGISASVEATAAGGFIVCRPKRKHGERALSIQLNYFLRYVMIICVKILESFASLLFLTGRLKKKINFHHTDPPRAVYRNDHEHSRTHVCFCVSNEVGKRGMHSWHRTSRQLTNSLTSDRLVPSGGHTHPYAGLSTCPRGVWEVWPPTPFSETENTVSSFLREYAGSSLIPSDHSTQAFMLPQTPCHLIALQDDHSSEHFGFIVRATS